MQEGLLFSVALPLELDILAIRGKTKGVLNLLHAFLGTDTDRDQGGTLLRVEHAVGLFDRLFQGVFMA